MKRIAVILIAVLVALAATFRLGGLAEAKKQPRVLWAVINADGSLVRGKHVNDPAVVFHPSAGNYQVRFTRNVDGCAQQVTTTGGFAGITGSDFFVDVDPGSVFVYTRGLNGSGVDLPFVLTVNC